jgi:hypothetical protein
MKAEKSIPCVTKNNTKKSINKIINILFIIKAMTTIAMGITMSNHKGIGITKPARI